MLKIEKTVLPSAEQWEIVIEGLRNPMNSWGKIDSEFDVEWVDDSVTPHEWGYSEVILGDNDRKLMTSLNKGGTEHSKYRRMLPVWVTVTAPLYWWKEADTYTIGKVQNSCSTMHRLTHKPFELSDFSFDHLIGNDEKVFTDIKMGDEGMSKQEIAGVVGCASSVICNLLNDKTYREIEMTPYDVARITIDHLNELRDLFLATKDKKWWWQIIQLLPSSYNQKRTLMLNYEVLAKMYRERKNHKLDEWHVFCDWIKSLPYSELITGEEDNA